MKAKWIVDKQITKYTPNENLHEQITNIGYDATQMQYIPIKNAAEYDRPYDLDDCVIVYGTIDFIRKIPKYFGIFLNENNLRYHKYTSTLEISADFYLNDDFVMTTYHDFKYNFDKYAQIFNTDALFIRPDSGSKLFTGMPIFGHNYKSELNALDQLSGVTNDNLIIVAKGKKIFSEARFIIAGSTVIDGSRYKIHGEHFEDRNISEEMMELAKLVAKAKNPPEEVFTCDIADTPNGVKIIELNSFSSAGWYGCDVEKVVIGVSKYVEELYEEQKQLGY